MRLEEWASFVDTYVRRDVPTSGDELQEVVSVQTMRSKTKERMTDEEWKKMLGALSESIGIKERGGYTRNLIEATLWMAQEDLRWTDLPRKYGSQYSAYSGFTRWARSGKWRAVMACLDDMDGMDKTKIGLEVIMLRYLRRNQRGEFQQ